MTYLNHSPSRTLCWGEPYDGTDSRCIPIAITQYATIADADRIAEKLRAAPPGARGLWIQQFDRLYHDGTQQVPYDRFEPDMLTDALDQKWPTAWPDKAAAEWRRILSPFFARLRDLNALPDLLVWDDELSYAAPPGESHAIGSVETRQLWENDPRFYGPNGSYASPEPGSLAAWMDEICAVNNYGPFSGRGWENKAFHERYPNPAAGETYTSPDHGPGFPNGSNSWKWEGLWNRSVRSLAGRIKRKFHEDTVIRVARKYAPWIEFCNYSNTAGSVDFRRKITDGNGHFSSGVTPLPDAQDYFAPVIYAGVNKQSYLRTPEFETAYGLLAREVNKSLACGIGAATQGKPWLIWRSSQYRGINEVPTPRPTNEDDLPSTLYSIGQDIKYYHELHRVQQLAGCHGWLQFNPFDAGATPTEVQEAVDDLNDFWSVVDEARKQTWQLEGDLLPTTPVRFDGDFFYIFRFKSGSSGPGVGRVVFNTASTATFNINGIPVTVDRPAGENGAWFSI